MNRLSILESEIIRLRAIEPEDIDLIYEWENDSSLWTVSNTLVPFSRYVLKKFIKNAHLDLFELKQIRLMIDVKVNLNGKKLKTVGSVDVFDFDPFHSRAGIGIMIYKQEDRGNHYATEALKLIINYSFNVLQIHQLYCNITKDNQASIHLFQKLGFQQIGLKKEWIKSGKLWLDEYVFQLIKQPD